MTRLEVNINDETATALRALAEKRNTTVTDTVRRSVSLYWYVDEAHRNGWEVQTATGSEITTLVLGGRA